MPQPLTIYTHYYKGLKVYLNHFICSLSLFKQEPIVNTRFCFPGGILLGMIEGISIMMNRWAGEEAYRGKDSEVYPHTPVVNSVKRSKIR